MSRLRLVFACAVLAAAPWAIALVLVAPNAGAQTSYEPSGCPDCRQKNKPGTGSGFRFDHECATDGSGNGRYIVTFYNHDSSRDAEAVVNGQHQIVPPGGQGSFVVPFGTRVATLTWQATYSDGKTVIPLRSQSFDCPCQTTIPPSTTTVTSSPATTSPSGAATTAPGPATSTPRTSVKAPAQPSDATFSLPATGGLPWGFILGPILVVLGIAILGMLTWLSNHWAERE